MRDMMQCLDFIRDDVPHYRPDQAGFVTFAQETLEKSEEFREMSRNRLRVLAYENLAKGNPEFKEMLEKRHKATAAAQNKMISRLRLLAARDHHRDLLVIPESEEDRIRRLLPKVAPKRLKLHYDPQHFSSLRELSTRDAWDALTHEVNKPFYMPIWADEPICPTGGSWYTWLRQANNEVLFISDLCGDGGSDDVYCTHGARFWWYLVGEHSETLTAFIMFDLMGSCTYRLNDGDLGIWILPEVTIKRGWESDWDDMETVYHQDRWLNLWLATYDGPTVDGDVPMGDFNLEFNPTPDSPFQFDIVQGQRYIIQVDVQIALLASYNGCIVMGEPLGTNPPLKCSLRGDCVLSRCC